MSRNEIPAACIYRPIAYIADTTTEVTSCESFAFSNGFGSRLAVKVLLSIDNTRNRKKRCTEENGVKLLGNVCHGKLPVSPTGLLTVAPVEPAGFGHYQSGSWRELVSRSQKGN